MIRSLFCALTIAAWTCSGTAYADSASGPALAQHRNCLSCHAQTRALMGPAFHDIALKYASRPDAPDYLARKIAEGSTGVWGAVPMPANTQVTPDDARALANWVLTLK